MTIPKSFIQDLLLRIDIVDIVDSRVPLQQKSSNNHIACCPFHQEKTPSFSVNRTKQFYHCFGCGEHGDVISFIMRYDRLNFVEAVLQLASQAGIPVPMEEKAAPSSSQYPDLYNIMAKTAQFYQEQLSRTAKAKQYLISRGVQESTAKTYQLGFAPPSWDNLLKYFKPSLEIRASLKTCGLVKNSEKNHVYDVFRDRIMFPIRDRKGRVLAFGGRVLTQGEPKYLNSPETPIFHKSSEVYGLYEALQANRNLEYAILVEGYMDVITLAQYGFTKAMACMGTAITSSHLNRIFAYTTTIIFCFDGDNAGQKAAWRAAENLLPILKDGLTAKFIFLPQGEDPDTFLKKFGHDAFQKSIQEAIVFSVFFWKTLTKELKLSTVEDKTKLYKTAFPLIEQIQGNTLKTMMYQTLERYTGIAKTSPRQSIAVAPNMTNTKQLTPMRTAIALLLQYPTLADIVAQSIVLKLNIPGKTLLQALLDYILTHPHCHTASILAAFQDNEYSTTLNQLATETFLIATVALHQHLRDVLLKIEENYYADMEEMLYKKLQDKSILPHEKQLFLQLQKLKQHLLSDNEKQACLDALEKKE